MFDFFRNSLSAWQWVVLGLVPPALIALYFLKLKREPLEVPSTYLWKRSLEDLHVNSLWQRLRRSLLLFLQLLIVLLAVLALLRPGWEGTRLDGSRVIFLVDNSASMSVTDAHRTRTRLDEAKLEINRLIDHIGDGVAGMIISFSSEPKVVQEFTENRQLLRERLAAIAPTASTTNLRGALALAEAFSAPPSTGTESDEEAVQQDAASLYIFSDGRVQAVEDVLLANIKTNYVPIGSFDTDNLAITNFTTRRLENRPEERQAFLQVTNFTENAQHATVELQYNGEFLDAKQVELAPDTSAGVVFPLADAPPGQLTARLTYELASGSRKDALNLDDVAYAALNPTQPGNVLVVTPGNDALEVALTTDRIQRIANVEFESPDVLQADSYRQAAESAAYQLIIYDQCAPRTLPRANTLFIGRLPPDSRWNDRQAVASNARDEPTEAAGPSSTSELVTLPQIIDWERSHPLLANVELGDVDIADSMVLRPPAGGNILIDSSAGPITAIAPRESYQDIVLGFEVIGHDDDGTATINTNWPRRLSFPTFWLNVLEHLSLGVDQAQSISVRPGEPVELRKAHPTDETVIVDPTGKVFSMPRTTGDVFRFHHTTQPGIYEVRTRGQIFNRFAVNLFDRHESDVRLRLAESGADSTRVAELQIGPLSITPTSRQSAVRAELWKMIVIGALFVLVLEWYIYNRRVYV